MTLALVIWNETVPFYLVWTKETAMPGWDEASVDDLLADPIVRDLMAADGVDPLELRVLLYSVQRTLERYAARHGSPTSLVSFVKLFSPRLRADAAQPTLPANRSQSNIRNTRIALADHSNLSAAPLGSTLGGDTWCAARS
jgi:hypothetical protein